MPLLGSKTLVRESWYGSHWYNKCGLCYDLLSQLEVSLVKEEELEGCYTFVTLRSY